MSILLNPPFEFLLLYFAQCVISVNDFRVCNMFEFISPWRQRPSTQTNTHVQLISLNRKRLLRMTSNKLV